MEASGIFSGGDGQGTLCTIIYQRISSNSSTVFIKKSEILKKLIYGWQYLYIKQQMPTLLIKDGFKFFFYANEHEPKHIHVTKAEGFAKIELSDLRVVRNYLRPSDLKKALIIVEQQRFNFERKWDEYFKR